MIILLWFWFEHVSWFVVGLLFVLCLVCCSFTSLFLFSSFCICCFMSAAVSSPPIYSLNRQASSLIFVAAGWVLIIACLFCVEVAIFKLLVCVCCWVGFVGSWRSVWLGQGRWLSEQWCDHVSVSVVQALGEDFDLTGVGPRGRSPWHYFTTCSKTEKHGLK